MINQAQPPLEFIPPHFNPLVLRAAKVILPAWIGTQTAITQIEAENLEVLADLYHQFQQGKIRFLMAFRHPNVQDPLCMGDLLWRLLPQMARKQQIPLQHPIHAHCIYDRGIPLWAGSYMGWIFSRLGGTPINRGKADWTGLRSARDLFANGIFPMAAAPEGATNGLNEIVSTLEPGIAQLGFWCAEDLQKAGRDQQVVIVPIGIQYHYVGEPWEAINRLLSEMEADSGLVSEDSTESKSLPSSLYQRLYQFEGHLLALMEEFYTRFYHRTLSSVSSVEALIQSTMDENQAIAQSAEAQRAIASRLQALLNVALQVAEEYFNLLPKGSLIDRCRRVEQAGWNYIYRDELKDHKVMSTIKRGLADRVAEEANLRMWHMRLVESFAAVTRPYALEKPSVERFAEITLLLSDILARIKGNSPFTRPSLGKQRVTMTIGQPLSVSDHYSVYQTNRQGARQAVAELTKDLQLSLESLIVSEK